METKLYRKYEWYNPLFVEVKDKEYKLENIIIYDENGVIDQVGRGFFDSGDGMTLNGEVIKKIKVDFKCKKHFIIKTSTAWDGEGEYSLYIYKNTENFEDLGKIKRYNSIYQQYSINGNKFNVYIEDLMKTVHNLNEEAKQQIKELEDIFSYGNKGIEESKLLEIFSKLQYINRDIIAEVEKVENYEV